MLTLLSLSFWAYFLYFFIVVFLACFIPGDVILKKIKLTIFQRVVLGISLGIILWGWQGILLGYLQLRWLTYLYLLVFLFIWLRFNFKKTIKELKIYITKIKIDYILILLILFGVSIQVLVVFANGIYTKAGLFFCCGNIFDNLLQIAITDQIGKQIPPFEPGLYGTYIHNYHYWGNLIIGELIRVFKLPLIASQFQYSTILISLLLGLNAVVIGQLLGLRRAFSRWLVFFLYFGGDLIFLLTFILGQGINFSMSSLEDGSKFLTNYPRGFSIILFLAGFNFLIIWIRKKTKYSGLIMAIVMGSLIGFKVYTGIFALAGLAALAVFYIITKRFKNIIFLFLAFIISLIVYLPVNSGAGGLYYTGLWIFENFASQEALGLHNLILAHYIYLDHNNIPRIILNELFFSAIYIFAIFGTKLLALFQIKKSLLLFGKELNIFLITGIIVSAVAGFFYQQNSGGSNSFNFLVSIFIIGSVYCAMSIYYLIDKINNKKLKYFIIIFIVTLTIPRVMSELNLNIIRLIKSDGFLISNDELTGFKKIAKLSDKNSLILVDHKVFMVDRESPYISFLTARRMFLSGQGDELNAHGIDFKKEQLIEDLVLNDNSPIVVGNILKNSKIDYIFTSPVRDIGSTNSASFLKTIYKNKKIKILKFDGSDYTKFKKYFF